MHKRRDWLANLVMWRVDWRGEWTEPAPIVEEDESANPFGFPSEDGISCPICGDYVDRFRQCRKRKAAGV